MNVLENLISELRSVCAGLEDRRVEPAGKRRYAMADIGLERIAPNRVHAVNRIGGVNPL